MCQLLSQDRRPGVGVFFQVLFIAIVLTMPGLADAQASPFMTGATALQTKGRTLLAAATRMHEAFPNARIGAFAFMRTMGLVPDVGRLIDPCIGEIRWEGGEARRTP